MKPLNMRRTPVRRKIAAATWRPSRDGRIYARLEVDVSPALAYAERVLEESGVTVSVTHIVGGALARVLREVPEFRARMVFGRVVPLESCDIAFAVDIAGGSDLAPIKVRAADTLTPAEIATALQRGADRLRAGHDGGEVEVPARGRRMFLNMGIAMDDIALASLVLERATERGIGQRIDFP